MYDIIKHTEGAIENEALPKLIVENFDDEQIWQELELQNYPLVQQLVSNVSKTLVCKNFAFAMKPRKGKEEIVESEGENEENTDKIEENESDCEDSDDDLDELDINLPSKSQNKGIFGDEDEELESEEEQELEKLLDKATQENKVGDEESEKEEMEEDDGPDSLQSQRKHKEDKMTKKETKITGNAAKRKTLVDDKFFSLADMEAFLDQEDAKEERKRRNRKGRKDDDSSEEEEEEIDYFADEPTSEEDDGDEDEEESEKSKVQFMHKLDIPW